VRILFHHRIRSKDGQFVHIEELTRALKGLGHEVFLVGPSAIETEAFGADAGIIAWLKEVLPGVIYEVFEFGYAFLAYVRLRRAVQRYRPDCLYERYNLFLPAGVWLKRRCKLPMLLEVNAPLLDERKKYNGLSLIRLARWTEEHTWRGADCVLPVSQVLAELVRRAGVPDSRIVVIPNGVDREHFQNISDRSESKRRLGLEGRLVLGFTGFVREWHGLDQVVEMLAENSLSNSLHLLLVGDGPARQELEKKARALGVEGKLTITGVIDRDSVAHYLSAFDIALQPAVTDYASPLKVFEYMAMGCAIVAPAKPNIQEILTSGKDAVLFDPGDRSGFRMAVERVCNDSALREQISKRAQETIIERDLTWESNARRVISIYVQLGVRDTRPNADQ